jgi:hypothetical protein
MTRADDSGADLNPRWGITWFANSGHESERIFREHGRNRRVDVDGIGVFYREAGSRNSGKLKSDEGIASRALPNLRIF